MTLNELVALTVKLCKDPSYERGDRVSKINRALLDVAKRVRVPVLETSGTVAALATAQSASLPSNFSHSLFRASRSGYRIAVVDSHSDILELYGDNDVTGDVLAVTGARGVLDYFPSPEADQAVKIHYFRKPAVMVDDVTAAKTVEPEAIPAEHHDVIALGACMFMFEEIEFDNETGMRPNYEHFKQRYEARIQDMAVSMRQSGAMASTPETRVAFQDW
jgi:hypothetical protein